MLAKNVNAYLLIYQQHLASHGIDDDSNSISVEDLVYFVENEIDEDHRLSYGWDPAMKALPNPLTEAAPELLRALEEQVSFMEEDQETGAEEGIYDAEPREDIEYLKELIKKAKGE